MSLLERRIKKIILLLSLVSCAVLLICFVLSFFGIKEKQALVFLFVLLGNMAAILLLFFTVYRPFVDYRHELEELFSRYDVSPEESGSLFSQLESAIKKEYSAKLLFSQTRIDTLQSQINPHFLYNTLEEIRGLAIIKDEKEIADMTEALSLMFRYSISNNNNTVTFDQEIRNLENYILIQRFRFPDRFTLQYDFDKTNESLMNYLLPKLTLQPIVENAIQHGFDTIDPYGLIIIKAVTTQNRLLIRIVDNGQGMDLEKLNLINAMLDSDTISETSVPGSKKTGIALTNVNTRIKLMYGMEYGLSVSSVLGFGTTVEIRLPLLKE